MARGAVLLKSAGLIFPLFSIFDEQLINTASPETGAGLYLN